jgi:phage tail tape-measure protein
MANTRQKQSNTATLDANRDPITGEPGAHPVGVGVGAAAAGAAAGAAGGAIGGPVGAAAGAVIGGIVGGLAGKDVAERIDPTVETAYWRENYRGRPYFDANTAYEEYHPAYEYGWESRSKYPDRNFDEVESHLARDWQKAKSHANMTWDKAKYATKDAWERVSTPVSGKHANNR